MKKFFFFAAVLGLSLCFSANSIAQTKEDSTAIVNANWETISPAKGLTYKHFQFQKLYGGAQNISIIEANLHKYKIKIISNNGRELPSKRAEEMQAIAAINGTFFDMSKGNSDYFIMIDGKVKDTTVSSLSSPYGGALIINGNKIKITNWDKNIEQYYRDLSGSRNRSKFNVSVIASMPLLLKDGTNIWITSFMPWLTERKHPRSIIYLTANKVGLMVIDGRAEGKAIGMNAYEMQHFLRILGVKDAMNLDGGGSSTLWCSGLNNPEISGVLNMPCDNKKFDHQGERKVANEICLFIKKSGK